MPRGLFKFAKSSAKYREARGATQDIWLIGSWQAEAAQGYSVGDE
jgi:hypothetical protein